MVELFELLLLGISLAFGLGGFGLTERSRLIAWSRKIAAPPRLVVAAICCTAFFGCLTFAGLLHEPVPRINDEFSYLLMSDTFTSGRVANPSPPLPEFFDTFHVLIRPVYASKYFPVQGLFLALGQKLTGHTAVGVWLSSALACGAVCWMLRAWVGPTWGFFGALLMLLQFGVFSYWSQSYWGGMVAALGGALYFGAIRQLWERISWQNSALAAVGLVILANSRPLEGAIAATPVAGLFLLRIVGQRRWKQLEFWRELVLPAGVILLLGAAAMGAYNRAITGSALQPPYLLHEKQYQESPQFVFMPPRPKLTYSSPWVAYLYEVMEMRLYLSQRTPLNVMITAARKLRDWWSFYCGILLSAPLVLAAWLRRGWMRYCQIALLAGFLFAALAYDQQSALPRIAIDLLAVVQFVLLWYVFDELWSRLAIATTGLLLLQAFLVKYAFPHYFASTACLVLYLQVEALRRIWNWRRDIQAQVTQSRAERRMAARKSAKSQIPAYPLRGFVILLPLACLILLVFRVEARINDWHADPHDLDFNALIMHDWSLRRAELEQWLEKQPGPQLVFVRYFPTHDVNDEWVWNRADIMHSKVIWARDLGSDHNSLLLQQMADRMVWSLLADTKEPQLVPYAQVMSHAPGGLPPPEAPPFPKEER